MRKVALKSFSSLDPETLSEVLAQAGYRAAACYQISGQNLTLRLVAGDINVAKWPAKIDLEHLLHYSADQSNLLPTGWYKPAKKNWLELGFEKKIYFYFPEQEFANFELVLAFSGDGLRPARQGEVEANLEIICQRLIRLYEKQATARGLNESLFSELKHILTTELQNLLSHELRTPLTVLSGYLAMLHQQDGGKLQGPIDVAERAVAQMMVALERMNTSLIESDDIQIELSPCSLETILTSLRQAVADSDLRDGLQLNITADTREPMVLDIDLQRLGKAFWEVLLNASRFSRHGALNITAYRHGDSAVIDFVDDGPGVRPGSEELIFIRFYHENLQRKRRIGQEAGAGIGLYVARKIAEEHGGQLHYVRQENGQGGFRFILPLKLEEKRAS